eukprot:671936-Prymnesium_polylepis.1
MNAPWRKRLHRSHGRHVMPGISDATRWTRWEASSTHVSTSAACHVASGGCSLPPSTRSRSSDAARHTRTTQPQPATMSTSSTGGRTVEFFQQILERRFHGVLSCSSDVYMTTSVATSSTPSVARTGP